MRYLYTYLLIFLAFMASSAYAQKIDSGFHIYLLLGQSNMAGRGEMIEPYKSQSHSRVLALTKEGEWKTGTHPLHYDKPKVAGVGPGLAFGIAMADADSNITIGLVPCAVGGTSINLWVPGGYDSATNTHPYDDAVVRIKAAMQVGVVKGILWMQGESDAGKANEYLPKIAALIQRLRTLVNNQQLPFVAAELGRYNPAYHHINKSIRQVASIPFAAVVSSKGLTHTGDTIHLNAHAATILGGRFAKKMQQLIGPE